ncbi:MAG: hypothetical protein JWO05_2212 [Gemmatimonadetes bacterium]|nr:hypothetical protein [Gemmatimonadota bacterium]
MNTLRLSAMRELRMAVVAAFLIASPALGRDGGPIIASERIVRLEVHIPFNLVGEALKGSVHASGAWAGSHEGGMLSAGRMVLHRAAPTGRDTPR